MCMSGCAYGSFSEAGNKCVARKPKVKTFQIITETNPNKEESPRSYEGLHGGPMSKLTSTISFFHFDLRQIEPCVNIACVI